MVGEDRTIVLTMSTSPLFVLIECGVEDVISTNIIGLFDNEESLRKGLSDAITAKRQMIPGLISDDNLDELNKLSTEDFLFLCPVEELGLHFSRVNMNQIRLGAY